MRFWERRSVAIALWALVLIGVAVAAAGKKPGKLYATFVAAGDHFRHAEPLYEDAPQHLDQYRYSPLAAAAFTPWGLLPTPAGAVLWRWGQALALLLALRWWARVTVPSVPWPALAVLVLPLAVGNVFNGQLNTLVCALMLAGLAAFARERYGLAAVAVAGAALFKIYPLALGMLLCVVEPRRFGPRLVLACVVGCLVPFALQSPEYVAGQFADWTERVGSDDRTAQPIHKGYHDFQKLLRRWGQPTPLEAYRVMEVAAGALAAGLVLWGRRRGWDRDRQVQACAGLGFVWCTLFGPATESATYMLLAPVAAHAVRAVTGRPLWERVLGRGGYVLILSAQVGLWLPRAASDAYRAAVIPQAHGALILLVWMIATMGLVDVGGWWHRLVTRGRRRFVSLQLPHTPAMNPTPSDDQ
jgi:hypothetical protein